MNKKHCHICPWWMAYTFDNPLRNLVQNPKKILEPHLKEGMTFLDLGCGMGFYSIKGAKIVGDKGSVISVDVQAVMLEVLEKRAKKVGVNHIIKPHLALQDKMFLDLQADFALAMWMVHETGDIKSFLKQVKEALKPGGRFLIIEPSHHLPADLYDKEMNFAKEVGFELLGEYKDAGLFSKGFLFKASL